MRSASLLCIFVIAVSKGWSLHQTVDDVPLLKSAKPLTRVMPGILPHERLKRSDAAESPMRVAPNKAYLQNGRAYVLPCTVIQPGDRVTIVFWQRGVSRDPARRQLILREAYPDDGQNSATSPRYQISPSYGIIIDPVILNDTDRYWCKTVQGSTGTLVEDYLDVTVLGKTFPRESESSASNVSISHLDNEVDVEIECPILAKTPAQTDLTVYWSVFSDTSQSLDIIFAMFPDGEMLPFEMYPKYSLVGINGLSVKNFTNREERYCCHVFEEENNLRTGCVNLTWLAKPKQRYPAITGCDETGDNLCDVRLTADHDCARLECSIRDVYPKPALHWSFENSDAGRATPTYFQATSSTNNSADQTYTVTSMLYVVELQPHETCEFTCTADGDAITEQPFLSRAFIERINESTAATSCPTVVPVCADCSCRWASVVFLTMLMMVLVFILIIGIVLIFPRNRNFIQKHIEDFPTFSCLLKKQVTDAEENARNTELDARSRRQDDNTGIPTETSPMLSRGVSDGAESMGGRVCLMSRRDPIVSITDSKHKWRPVGEFVTETVLADESESGFQAIKDVICTQDGGLVVIDASGLHHFNSAYNYNFVDLNKILGEDSYFSVAHHSGNKLLFGLSRGRIVQFNIESKEISKFGTVTPVGHTDVHLADLSVDRLGFVFAGDRNGKAVSMFDDGGGCLTRMEIGMEPARLCAHARNESQSIFVSSGDAVKKYNIVKSSTNAKISARIHFTIDKEVLKVHRFYSGCVTVQDGKLLVVSHLEVGQKLLISEHDAGKGTKEHSIVVDALGLRSVKFMGRDKIAVYTDDAVYLFERDCSD